MTAATLDVDVPERYAPERAYAARAVLGSLLGYVPRVRSASIERVTIRVPGETRWLTVADGLFATPERAWLTPASVPRAAGPVRRLDGALAAAVPAEALPHVFGDGTGAVLLERDSEGRAHLDLDVFGTTFFTLTRYEERAAPAADEHGRFPAAASLAARSGFVRRPIADEYAAVLRAAIEATWPRLPRPRRSGGFWLTHDVDWPLVTLRRRAGEVVRSAAADVLARRSPGLAARRVAGWLRGRRGDFGSDPGDTFDFLAETAERAGARATFTFLAGGDAPLDGRYRLADPWIRRLLGRLAGRGHELGFHASYEAYDDPDRVAAEFASLRREAAALGIEQSVWRGRQHFLRWRNPVTWQAWSDAGLAVDSSLCFAEAPGFRAGTCHPYPVFDLDRRCELPLVELPLTLMDVSAARYARLSYEATVQLAQELARACRRAEGTFVLLWHNDAVMTEASRRLYRDVVAVAAGGAA